jgi:hypothetical protein
MSLRALFPTFLLGVSTALAWEPDFVLRVYETTLYADCQPRLSVVVNGTLDRPAEARGDNSRIKVQIQDRCCGSQKAVITG